MYCLIYTLSMVTHKLEMTNSSHHWVHYSPLPPIFKIIKFKDYYSVNKKNFWKKEGWLKLKMVSTQWFLCFLALWHFSVSLRTFPSSINQITCKILLHLSPLKMKMQALKMHLRKWRALYLRSQKKGPWKPFLDKILSTCGRGRDENKWHWSSKKNFPFHMSFCWACNFHNFFIHVLETFIVFSYFKN